ncbi:hypothetical protein [Pseudacidovorax intermedius]|uniref:hypothetical protein n=1 Tax=Pseudacidovorax intermedius TaxID=433924 RepID=UPI0026EAF0E1|nr:hypothetical protein [Pseudacidovorax intermedius]
MDARLTRLEDRFASVAKDLAVIKSNYATKADVADAKVSIIIWVVGATFASQLLPALPSLLRALGWLK